MIIKKPLREIFASTKLYDEWRKDYEYYVTRFREEICTKDNWKDWNPDVWNEFMKRREQCVSSLGQGFFTDSEIEEIKKRWNELNPLFREVAQSNELRLDLYKKIEKILDSLSSQNRKAAKHRLIASFQPGVLCSLVADKYLYELFDKLKRYSLDHIPNPTWDWYKDSNTMCNLVQQCFPKAGPMDLVTYPWQLSEQIDNIMKSAEYFKDILVDNYNLILTGAPGTGKTYLAFNIAALLDATRANRRCEMVQFHPSYDYTDFVEGLRPIQKNGVAEIGFERTDGVFKKFCAKAEKDPDNKYVFIIDEINRGDISKIFGELFFSIDPGYRSSNYKVNTQYQNLIKEGENFADGFYVPDNVLILGTMNDIDRSVESMDFAMRRRFAWREIKAEDEISISMLNGLEEEVRDEAKKRLHNLNKAIWSPSSGDEGSGIPGLSSAYHIGPAYFLKIKNYLKDGDSKWKRLWENHLSGILYEYLRGSEDASRYMRILKKAYGIED